MRNPLTILLSRLLPNKSLRILIGVNTALVFVLGMFGPFYAVYVQKLGGSIAFAGLSWAVFAIVAGLLTLLFSRWGLRVKEQELMIALGYLVRSIVFLSYAFMYNIPQLLLTQVLWGIGAAIGNPAFDAVYAEHTTRKQSIAQWGQWEGISSIATGAAALVGGILIQTLGYQFVFLTMAATTACLGIFIWALPRDLL